MNEPRIRLLRAQLQDIERAAEAAYPEEACGLLVGRSQPGGAWQVSAVEASTNVAEPPRTRRFEVDPKLRLRLERELRDCPDSVVGVYHSHPNGSAAPSETDISMIFEPEMVWLITAVADGKAGATKAYKPTEDGSAFRLLGLDLGSEEA
ncbi:MAG: M67 family metallopeptidase [Rhodospirillales bacterium]|nr:M67 family metallopeptidase [Rhodospirillales bacterium]